MNVAGEGVIPGNRRGSSATWWLGGMVMTVKRSEGPLSRKSGGWDSFLNSTITLLI